MPVWNYLHLWAPTYDYITFFLSSHTDFPTQRHFHLLPFSNPLTFQTAAVLNLLSHTTLHLYRIGCLIYMVNNTLVKPETRIDGSLCPKQSSGLDSLNLNLGRLESGSQPTSGVTVWMESVSSTWFASVKGAAAPLTILILLTPSISSLCACHCRSILLDNNVQVGSAICRSLGWHQWTHITEMSTLTLIDVPRLPLKWPCGIFQSHDKTTSLWKVSIINACSRGTMSQNRKWKNTSLLLSSNQ